MADKLRVALIIASLNEIEGMKWFMPRIKKEWYDELIVVDGGSTDGTVEYCRAQGYPVFLQERPGLPRGLAEAVERTTAEIVVTLSPDGNSLPEVIPDLLAKINEGYDMVIASRYLDGAKSADDDVLTGFGNRLFTFLINLIFSGRYTDTLVIFRAYRRDAIEKMNLCRQEEEDRWRANHILLNSWEVGSSIRAAKLGLKVAAVPGDEPKRIGGIRKLSIVRNGLGVLWQIAHELVTGLRFAQGKGGRMTGKTLTDDQVAFYRDNGYLIVDGVIPPQECDRLLSIFKAHANPDFAAILNLDREVPGVRQIMRDRRAVDIIEQLQGTEVVALMSQVIFKQAGSPYAGQAWNPHQDNAYPQAEHGAYITINIFLEDCDRENGCLYVYPGSHKEKLLPFEPTISYREKPGTNPGNTVKIPETYEKVDAVVKKGGLIVLHGDLIHGSYANVSAHRSRPLYSISYLTKGKEFIPGQHAKRMVIPLR